MSDKKLLLDLAFNHIPAGTVPHGVFQGEPYSEFWWKETITRDGYVLVWYDEDEDDIITHHTYNYPPDIYR